MAPGMKNNYLDFISTPTPSRAALYGGGPDAIGPSLFTPSQADYRTIAKGYDGDPALEGRGLGHSYVFRIQRHSDGTADSVRLDPTATGWVDQGGPTPSDFKAILP